MKLFDRVDHIGVVVDDFAMALEFMRSLGFPLERETFHEPSNRRTALFNLGNTLVEIIEDMDPQSKIDNLRGERARIDHIALDAGSDIESVVGELARLGVAPNSHGIDFSPVRASFFAEVQALGGLSLQVVSHRGGV